MRCFVLFSLTIVAASAQAPPAPPKCDTPEFRQLDFWTGTWSVESNGRRIGESRVERVLDGCLILEHWYGLDGDRGKSLSWYDRHAKSWRQVYVGAGWSVDYEGAAITAGSMQFTGKQSNAAHPVRLTFTPNKGAVRQHKERQNPDGSWTTVYDFTYRSAPVTQPEAGKVRCTTPEARQFDFWAGDWDVLGRQGRTLGHNRIESALDACLLIENWTGAGGASGKSFNFYDPARKQWRQVWVAPGGSLNLAGEWRDGAIRYTGQTPGASGPTQERLSFTPSPDGTVRQFWEQSRDGGKTWGVAFDGKYVRKPAR